MFELETHDEKQLGGPIVLGDVSDDLHQQAVFDLQGFLHQHLQSVSFSGKERESAVLQAQRAKDSRRTSPSHMSWALLLFAARLMQMETISS